jgi:hypothetical protein
MRTGRCAQVAEWLMAADCKSAAPWSYGGSNPPLCTRIFSGCRAGVMTASGKAVTAAGMLLALVALAWFTLDAGRIRTLTLLILGLFLFRVVIHAARSRYDE